MARVWLSRRLPVGAWLRMVQQCRIFRRRVWLTSGSDQADSCASEFVWMSSTRWNDQNLFWTTLKIQLSLKNTSVFWRTGLWYQLLVGETTGGGFETLGGDKTHCFISRTKAYKHKKLNNTHPLSFSLVFLSILSTQNSISSACYLYTNSKQENSTFKCEGGWRLWRQTAGGWRLAAGRWQLVAAFLDLLDGLSLIQQL